MINEDKTSAARPQQYRRYNRGDIGNHRRWPQLRYNTPIVACGYLPLPCNIGMAMVFVAREVWAFENDCPAKPVKDARCSSDAQ